MKLLLRGGLVAVGLLLGALLLIAKARYVPSSILEWVLFIAFGLPLFFFADWVRTRLNALGDRLRRSRGARTILAVLVGTALVWLWVYGVSVFSPY